MKALSAIDADFAVPAREQLRRFREHFTTDEEYRDQMWAKRDRFQGVAGKPSTAWPFVRKAGMHPLERVEQALVAAKPSNVKQLRGART